MSSSAPKSAVSNLTRLLLIADEAARLKRPLPVRDLEALCYLLETDKTAGRLSCSYKYRFDPGLSSSDFEADIAQLLAAGYAAGQSPLAVSDAGQAWLAEGWRASAVNELRTVARRVLPNYLAKPDLIRSSIERSEEIGTTALQRDLEEARRLTG